MATWMAPRRTRARPATSTSSSTSCCGAAWPPTAPMQVATGHYARVEDRDGRRVLLRAADADKDQTYFLWVLDQEQLRHTRFPLGELTKPEVRQIATELGLPTAAKPESQEICFVPAGDYRELLAERRGYAGEPGPIVDADGTEVGTHTGYAHYTVGQRHGLGVALGEAVYVREVRPASNTVVIGRREEVAASTFTVDGRRFVAGEPPAERFSGIGPHPAPRAGRAGRDHPARRRSVRGRDRRARSGHRPRARRRSCMTATSAWVAGGSLGPHDAVAADHRPAGGHQPGSLPGRARPLGPASSGSWPSPRCWARSPATRSGEPPGWRSWCWGTTTCWRPASAPSC